MAGAGIFMPDNTSHHQHHHHHHHNKPFTKTKLTGTKKASLKKAFKDDNEIKDNVTQLEITTLSDKPYDQT